MLFMIRFDWQLPIAQACFTMTDPTTQEKQSYGISLDSVKSVLEYKNSYEFGIPYIEVSLLIGLVKNSGNWKSGGIGSHI